MNFDNGYVILKRYDKNEFSVDDAVNFRIEVMYYSLIKNASWDETASCAVVNTASIIHIYKHFGRANVHRYLQRLVEKDFIEIISIGKNQYQGGIIKIKHFPREHLG